jgi:phosphoenolpyruvate carboxykinase (GTP)
MGDYFQHWIEVGKRVTNPPKFFAVNWFRQDQEGRFLWPGYSENMRVLAWIIDRCKGKGEAVETPMGLLPTPRSINRDGLNVPHQDLEEIMSFHPERAKWEIEQSEKYFSTFGDRFPKSLKDELNGIKQKLG